jgi:DNA repair protein RadC
LEARVEGQPVLSSWDALGDYLHASMAHRRTEEVRILFLNTKNMLIVNEALWQGSVDEASVHVREVIARAIALGATALASSTIIRAAIRHRRGRISVRLATWSRPGGT